MGLKPKIIQVSFKQNIKDTILYDWIIKHNCKSAFIKDVMREKMENENKKIITKKKSNHIVKF